jgi:hypothetical protein
MTLEARGVAHSGIDLLKLIRQSLESKETVLAGEKPPGLGVDLKPEIQAIGVTNTILSLEMQLCSLRQDCSRLQQYVDQYGEAVVERLRTDITDIGSAFNAMQTYGSEWFQDQLYSEPVLQGIARTLLDLTVPYLGQNEFWTKIVSGDFSIIERAAFAKPQKTPGNPFDQEN